MSDFVYNPKKRFKVPTYVDANSGKEELCRVFKDMFDIVVNDKWAFVVIWGEQRTGKSSMALWVVYYLWRMLDPNMSEEDLWNHVYGCCVFNLSQLIYKMKDSREPRVWDFAHTHHRIPVVLWDDFAVHSNKAATRHELAWDLFKGGFDALGTKVGVIIVTMSTPEQPTSQIEHKYTHEIVIPIRGRYKYDKVIWLQDYRGWQAKHTKDWQQEFTFEKVPQVRFDPYDEMRMSLADEMLSNIEDAIAMKLPWTAKRINEDDAALLESILKIGPVKAGETRREHFAESIIKCKARQLIIAVRDMTKVRNWNLDITPFGIEVIDEYNRNQKNKE